ncbi:MAG: acetyl-CoA carboxylase biotin carboxylase subunit, partial [candidate division Zixibacteria bacterium]|nr:acetyl-CoA carboxylase biotin carboxylase subunit [candidate division Zixibacteria bacterium]
QVEHPITEMVTGVDLVVEQIRIAAGQPLSDQFGKLTQRGHAIGCRIYAEDGENNFMPSTGKIIHYSEPSGPGVRVDSGVVGGVEITIDYDPIMAKLIVHAPTRELAILKMIDALNNYKLLGVRTSKKFMIDVMMHPEFAAGRTYTDFIEKHMSDREIDGAKYQELAVAVAAAASTQGVGKPVSVAGAAGSAMAEPSQLIGGWQIGDSIEK